MKYVRRLRWAFEDWLSARTIRTTIGPADICQKLGHVIERRSFHEPGRTVVAEGCLRCDRLLSRLDYDGQAPLPKGAP